MPLLYKQNKAPFYGTTSYNQQYQPIQIQANQGQESLFDSRQYIPGPKVKFDGQTSYKDHYKGYEML